MSVAVFQGPRLVHATPGRVRVHCPALSGGNQREIENGLRRLPGVEGAQANPDTGNVLVRFSPALISAEGVLDAVRALKLPAVPELPLSRLDRDSVPPCGSGRGRRAAPGSPCGGWTETPPPRAASWSGWSVFRVCRPGPVC